MEDGLSSDDAKRMEISSDSSDREAIPACEGTAFSKRCVPDHYCDRCRTGRRACGAVDS